MNDDEAAAPAPRPPRPRHDGFTAAKQKIFFKALKKTGCLADAAGRRAFRATRCGGTATNGPPSTPRSRRALAIASVGLELIALKRATEGAEEKVYRDGKLVMTRIKPSDSMLRLLMQGANPKKYGRTGRMPKKAVMKELRKEAMAKVRAKMCVSDEELVEVLMKQLRVLKRRDEKEKLAAGYSVGPDGLLVPPGYRMVADPAALPAPDEAG